MTNILFLDLHKNNTNRTLQVFFHSKMGKSLFLRSMKKGVNLNRKQTNNYKHTDTTLPFIQTRLKRISAVDRRTRLMKEMTYLIGCNVGQALKLLFVTLIVIAA